MSKKTALSKDEKARRALEFLLGSKSVFQMKELEKILYREKGIVPQTVKDVIKSLQDEDLVETDKVGTSTYYWAFASKRSEAMKKKLANYEEKLAKLKANIAEADKELESTESDDLEERKAQMIQINELILERDQLMAKWNSLKNNSPEHIKELSDKTKKLRLEANKWTDYIENIKFWLREKWNMETSQFNQMFELEEDFDYIE